MNKIKGLLLGGMLVLILSSCDILKNISLSVTTTSSGSSTISTTTSITTTTSSTTTNSEPEKEINFYAINDFHGAIIEDGNRAGIVKVASYLKELKENEDAVLINSGDLWQGSLESNYNRGHLLTDVMNMVQFDCFTLGNHEFDWGQQYITENRERDYGGYSTPFLAANIYSFNMENKRVGDFANLGEKYTIRTLENGLKVGIIGVIGSSQLTSISSHLVDNVTFQDPTLTIKQLSNELRTEQDCDVVVASCHCDQDDIDESVASTSNVSGKKYVDAVFCAHSHQNETKEVNGVPFIQSSSYGQMIGKVSLKYKDGSCTVDNYGNLYTRSLEVNLNEDIQTLVDNYLSETAGIGDEVLGYATDTFYSADQIPNMVCLAMANLASINSVDIDYAICNVARSYLYEGNITYSDLYRALPFDNEIYIIETSAEHLLKEASYNYFFRLDNEAIDENRTYRVAVIDYLATHRNVRRDYDYFPDVNIVGVLRLEECVFYSYRDMVADYIRNCPLNMDPSYFSAINETYGSYFDSSIIDQAINPLAHPYWYSK